MINYMFTAVEFVERYVMLRNLTTFEVDNYISVRANNDVNWI